MTPRETINDSGKSRKAAAGGIAAFIKRGDRILSAYVESVMPGCRYSSVTKDNPK